MNESNKYGKVRNCIIMFAEFAEYIFKISKLMLIIIAFAFHDNNIIIIKISLNAYLPLYSY